MPANIKAYEQIWKSLTGVPEADLSGKRYTFVKVTSTGGIVPATAGSIAMGVAQEGNKIDQPEEVAVHGVSFIKLGGTVAAGAECESDANGAAITLASGKSLGTILVGGAAGDIGSVLLK